MDGQTSLDQIPWFRSSADEIGLIPMAIELAFVKRLSKALLTRQCKLINWWTPLEKGQKAVQSTKLFATLDYISPGMKYLCHFVIDATSGTIVNPDVAIPPKGLFPYYKPAKVD